VQYAGRGSHGACSAYALLRLYLVKIKDLTVVENAKEHGFSQFTLQAIKIGPRVPSRSSAARALDPNSKSLSPKRYRPVFWILIHKAVLLQHHHQPMYRALVQT